MKAYNYSSAATYGRTRLPDVGDGDRENLPCVLRSFQQKSPMTTAAIVSKSSIKVTTSVRGARIGGRRPCPWGGFLI